MKQKGKVLIDFVMIVMLLCQMGYMLVGETLHEWVGTAMFLLFIIHHILNRRWYGGLLKGRYTPFRILQILINILLLVSMIGLMISGIVMSRVVFAFFSLRGGMALARIVHMLASYWGFVLMSIHLGMHWGMVIGMTRKLWGENRGEKSVRFRQGVLRLLAAAVSVYGIYSFVKQRIVDYLFLRTQFVFFDFEQQLLLFFAEYIAMMGLWTCIAYYVTILLQKRRINRS